MRTYFGKVLILAAVVSLVIFSVVPALAQYEFENGPQFDFGGQTVVIMKDREAGYPAEGTEYYDRWQAVEKFFNVKIEMIVTGQYNYQDMVARIMAGDPVDIIRLESPQMQQMISLGMMKPLNEVWGDAQIDKANLPDWVKYEYKLANRYFSYRGKIYATQAYDRNDGPIGAGSAGLWNKSMFEREGLPSLYDLVESGEWTWDKMAEICALLTKDTNGDGVVDQYGIGKSIKVDNGLTYWDREIDGRVVLTLDTVENQEAAEFIKRLVQAGVTTYSKPDAKADRDEFAAGHIGLYFGSGIDYWRGLQWWFNPNLMADDWGVVPPPKGPHASDGPSTNAMWMAFGVGIPISARYDSEALLTLFRAIFPRNPDLKNEYMGIYEGIVRSEEDFEAVQRYYLDVQSTDLLWTATATRHWPVEKIDWGPVYRGEKEFKTYVTEITPAFQAKLDDMFNKEF